jgi:hypothetical protein
MCDGCRNKYPLGPYYFQEYKPYVTKAEVERVRAESSADYVNPAEDAAACFEEYCAEKFKKGAAEHDHWLPDDASAEEILASVPVYDAQAAVRSALAMWKGVVRERARASYITTLTMLRHVLKCCPSSTKSCAMLMESARTAVLRFSAAPSHTGPIMCLCRHWVLDLFKWPTFFP